MLYSGAKDSRLVHASPEKVNWVVVTCFVEEHVMISRATGWNDGQLRWSVKHDVLKDQRLRVVVCQVWPSERCGCQVLPPMRCESRDNLPVLRPSECCRGELLRCMWEAAGGEPQSTMSRTRLGLAA